MSSVGMPIDILAHRANLNGPDRARENSLALCREALQAGFGLEIDLRRAPDGRFYLSHDPGVITEANALEAYSALFRQHPDLAIAINVKELGYEAELLRLQVEGTFGRRDFYFDFELLERETPGRSQRILQAVASDQGSPVRLAARLSDRHESVEQCLSIPADVVWADEFDSLWLTAREIEAMHNAGRRVYAISPELHGFNREERLRRWADFRAWGVDGLCTDYSLEARDFFAR